MSAAEDLIDRVAPGLDAPAPDYVKINVETAGSRARSICQIGIVGFRDGVEIVAYESLVDHLDRFSHLNTRSHGIAFAPPAIHARPCAGAT